MINKENSDLPPPLPAKAMGVEHSTEVQLVSLHRQMSLAASKIQHLEDELRLRQENDAHNDELLARNAREIRQLGRQLRQVTEERDGMGEDFAAKEIRYLDEIVNLSSEISVLKGENTKFKSENTRLHGDNTKMTAEIPRLRNKISELQIKLKELDTLIETRETAAQSTVLVAGPALKPNPKQVSQGQCKPSTALSPTGSTVLKHTGDTEVTTAQVRTSSGVSVPRMTSLKQQSAPQTPTSTNEANHEILCTALRQANSRLQREVIELTALTKRLENENEHFQVLLALSTVEGLQQKELRERLSNKNSANLQSPELRAAHYEILNLETQNVALRLCLERLVYRLLEESDFRNTIRERSSAQNLESFQRRLSSVCKRVSMQKEALHRSSRCNGIEMDWSIITSNAKDPKYNEGSGSEGLDQLVISPIRQGPDKHLTTEVVDSTDDLMPRRILSQSELLPLHTRTQT